MTTVFAPVFGDITTSAQYEGSEYYQAWKRCWEDYSKSDFVDLLEVKVPPHFEDVDNIMRLLVIESCDDLSKKVDTVAKGRQMLYLSRYVHLIPDYEAWRQQLHWLPLPQHARPWWELLDAPPMFSFYNALFDDDEPYDLTDYLYSNDAFVLGYFGHGQRETGEWILSSSDASAARSFRGLVMKFVKRLMGKGEANRGDGHNGDGPDDSVGDNESGNCDCTSDDGDRTEETELRNVALVVVSDSCSSGALCEQLQHIGDEEIECASDRFRVREILKAHDCAVAVQAACAPGQLAFCRYFMPLFGALQRESTYDFYVILKRLVQHASRQELEELGLGESETLSIVRPRQTPQKCVIGASEMECTGLRRLHLFDETDALALRVFWEHYGKAVLHVDDDQELCSVAFPFHTPLKKPKLDEEAEEDDEEEALDAADAPANINKDGLLGRLHEVEDVTAYTAGTEAYGFIAMVTLEGKKYSLHLHCKPNVTNTGTRPSEKQRTAPRPQKDGKSKKQQFTLTFQPVVSALGQTTFNVAEFECIESNFDGLAFRVIADTMHAARSEIHKFGIADDQITTAIPLFNRKDANDDDGRKPIRMFLVLAARSEELTRCIHAWNLGAVPFNKVNEKVTVLLYPGAKWHREGGKQPLIAGQSTQQQRHWLEGMLKNVHEFLTANKSSVVYSMENRTDKQVLVRQTVEEWLVSVTTYFAPGNLDRSDQPFKSFHFVGSVSATFAALPL